MCDIWINVLLQTSALVGPLHILFEGVYLLQLFSAIEIYFFNDLFKFYFSNFVFPLTRHWSWNFDYVCTHTYICFVARTGCIRLWPFFLLNITILFIFSFSLFPFLSHCDLYYLSFPPFTPSFIPIVFISPLFLFFLYILRGHLETFRRNTNCTLYQYNFRPFYWLKKVCLTSCPMALEELVFSISFQIQLYVRLLVEGFCSEEENISWTFMTGYILLPETLYNNSSLRFISSYSFLVYSDRHSKTG
jgi:hypothetical protein